MYYYSIYDEETHFNYTIDMIRLSCHLFKADCSQLRHYLMTFGGEYWRHNSFGKFAENWKKDNLWFGLGTKQTEDTPYLVFCCEFNPNKISKDNFELFLKVSKLICNTWTVKRFDLAIDIPFNINDLKFVDFYKRSYSVFYKDHHDKTFYFGKGDGHTKIYNKQIESNLYYPLTRYEVTRETCFNIKDIPPTISFNFPFLGLQKYICQHDDSTVDAIQFALNNGFCFHSLSRTYKSKFKIDLKYKTELKEDLANKCLHNFILKLQTAFI